MMAENYGDGTSCESVVVKMGGNKDVVVTFNKCTTFSVHYS